MAEPFAINALYDEYAQARTEDNAPEMRRLAFEVYQQARNMASKQWGHQGRESFGSRFQRLVHERNWMKLDNIVEKCLKNYNPDYVNAETGQHAQFSSYIAEAISKESSHSKAHFNFASNRGLLNHTTLTDEMGLSARLEQASVPSERAELTDAIYTHLRVLQAERPISVKFAVEYYVDDKTYEQIARENGVTKVRVQQRLDVIKLEMQKLLGKIYHDSVNDDHATGSHDAKIFGNCLQNALIRINETSKLNPDEFAQTSKESVRAKKPAPGANEEGRFADALSKERNAPQDKKSRLP